METPTKSNAEFLEDLQAKFEEEERIKADVVRKQIQKDSRIRTKYDKLRLWIYEKLVELTSWNQRLLQSLINKRNKYSETYLVHDSQRIFAEMLQGNQLDVLKELQVIGARKISDSRLLISFGTYEDEVTETGVKKKPGNEGMLVVVDAILDTDAPFLKIGMDTWNKDEDQLPDT